MKSSKFTCMKITIEHGGTSYKTDLAKGIDLSSIMGIPGKDMRAWGAGDVEISPVVNGDWIGSVAKGAPVNFFNIHFNPHGNGSHTEGYGHISPEKESVHDAFSRYHFVANLVRLDPESRGEDKVVTLKNLLNKNLNWEGMEALIVKTGNYPEGYDFSGTNAPYFEAELLAYIRDKGVQHVLVDTPSVDKEEDEGKLLAHHAFWNYPKAPREGCTISELLRIPDSVNEGVYLLNIQVACFANDASPSRPVIYPLIKD